jgi:hypothetical protein
MQCESSQAELAANLQAIRPFPGGHPVDRVEVGVYVFPSAAGLSLPPGNVDNHLLCNSKIRHPVMGCGVSFILRLTAAFDNDVMVKSVVTRQWWSTLSPPLR